MLTLNSGKIFPCKFQTAIESLKPQKLTTVISVSEQHRAAFQNGEHSVGRGNFHYFQKKFLSKRNFLFDQKEVFNILFYISQLYLALFTYTH
jgi:hypothetical protein